MRATATRVTVTRGAPEPRRASRGVVGGRPAGAPASALSGGSARGTAGAGDPVRGAAPGRARGAPGARRRGAACPRAARRPWRRWARPSSRSRVRTWPGDRVLRTSRSAPVDDGSRRRSSWPAPRRSETAGDPPWWASTSASARDRRSRRPARCRPRCSAPSLTHTFASRLPGYVGWHWAVTVARVPGDDERHRRRGRAAARRHRRCWPRRGCRGTSGCAPATSPSATCCPPPRTTRGSCPPTPPTTTRPTTRRAASSPSSSGLGRERVMSAEGRGEAVARWSAGDFGPASAMARTPPAPAPPAASSCRWPARSASAWAPAATPTPRRRPRRHRRLRLRRAQPGDARGRRADRGRPAGALRHRRTYDVLSD